MSTCPITGRKTEIELNTHELAWAAAFFDGEGTSGLDVTRNEWKKNFKSHSLHFRIRISQKDSFPIRRFNKAILNLGTTQKTDYFAKTNGQYTSGYYVTSSNFEKSQAIMALLWKYLSPRKRQQFKETVFKYHEALSLMPKTFMRPKVHINFLPPSPALANAVRKKLKLPLIEEKSRASSISEVSCEVGG